MSPDQKLDAILRMLNSHTQKSNAALLEFQKDCQVQAVISARLDERVEHLDKCVQEIKTRLDTIDRRNTGISAAAGAFGSAVVMGINWVLGGGKP